jgi:phosphoenolpyruvate carboxylase
MDSSGPETALRERFLDLLEDHIALAEHDPQVNPVKLLAYDISRELEAGEISNEDLKSVANALSDEALVHRASRMSTYSGYDTETAALDAFEQQVRRSAYGSADRKLGALKPFEQFCAEWETPRYGLVFTAHPTFSLSAELRQILAALAGQPDEKTKQSLLVQLKQAEHRPDSEITLDYEHGLTLETLANVQSALSVMTDRLIAVARELYPLQWAAMRPCFASVATWVGYDLDGRTDIRWWHSLVFKLDEKARQLSAYAALAHDVKARCGAESGAILDQLIARLDGAATLAQAQREAFDANLDDTKAFMAAADGLTSKHADRLTDPSELMAELERAIIGEVEDSARAALIGLAASIRTYGLGTAHIHVRINAAQVHNALRSHMGWTGHESMTGRVTVARLTETLNEAEPAALSFASLLREQTTAKRQMMLLERILSHVDAETPIRYLIAECEYPITALAALYFARLFGIDDRIDISPLFETSDALERGGRLIEQLLENEAYRDYVQTRGRFAIQTGFSDAGRFIGQLPASLAIERLQIQLARHMDAAKLTGIEALVFNTHGESAGRGCHPGSLAARQYHIMTPWARDWFKRLNISLKHESSFQGSDAFVEFATPQLAQRMVAGLLVAERNWVVDQEDPFYTDIAFTWDFYRALRVWQSDLYDDPNYREVIGAFAGNFLSKTGSRVSRRSATPGSPSRSDISLLRAIPHNAILQQLGVTANVLSGFGTAARPEFDRFVSLCSESDRVKGLIGMITFARRQSSLTSMSAYATVLTAGFWIARADALGRGAAQSSDRADLRELCLTVGAALEGNETAFAFSRLHDRLRTDLLHLEKLLNELDGAIDPLSDASRRPLYLLHAIRIALMMRLLLFAADLPMFAPRSEFSREVLVDLLLEMRVEEAINLLAETFPKAGSGAAQIQLAEPSDYGAGRPSGYPHIHENFVEPMREIGDLLKVIGVGLSHRFGAYG